jgi:hypothetical protein
MGLGVLKQPSLPPVEVCKIDDSGHFSIKRCKPENTNDFAPILAANGQRCS